MNALERTYCKQRLRQGLGEQIVWARQRIGEGRCVGVLSKLLLDLEQQYQVITPEWDGETVALPPPFGADWRETLACNRIGVPLNVSEITS